MGIGAFVVIYALITFFGVAGRNGEEFMSNYVNILGYILVGIAILGILFGFVLSLIANPSSVIKSLIGAVGMLVLFGIAWALSGGVASETITESTSHMVGAMIVTTYLALGVAVVGILFLMVQRVFN